VAFATVPVEEISRFPRQRFIGKRGSAEQCCDGWQSKLRKDETHGADNNKWARPG
jgi:hypothetical protein